MKRLFTGFFIFFLLSLPPISLALDSEIDTILTSAENFFLAMKEKNYNKIWESLTHKSQKTIIQDVYKSIKKLKSKVSITKDEIYKDFMKNGELSKTYWNAFLTNFDPDLVLEHSKWEMGTVKKDKAQIIITYKKSERPAKLKMFKENSKWKIGLVETFWIRKE